MLRRTQGFAEARGATDRTGSLHWDEKLGCAEVGWCPFSAALLTDRREAGARASSEWRDLFSERLRRHHTVACAIAGARR